MKIIVVIFGIVLLCASCQSNAKNQYPEYYRTYNQVLLLEKDGKIEEAITQFQKAEKLVDFVPPTHYITARSLALDVANCDLAKSYFQKAVDNGFEFEKFNFTSNECPKLTNSSITAIAFDTQYRDAVLEMIEVDQAVRRGTYTERPAHEVDSINIHSLLSLIEEKGYPNPKIIGSRAASDAFIIMLHFDSDIGNKKLKPILDKAYKEGLIDPNNYAWIVDRRRNWGPDKLDPYYYQIPTKKYFEMTAGEIAEIDQRRDSLGLKPLSEMNITKTERGISIQM